MKKLFQISLLLWLVANATAQESSAQKSPKVLHTYDWKDLSAQIPNSQIISMDGVSVLKIEKTNAAPSEISLLTITNSLLVQKANSIEWEMKYEDVSLTNLTGRYFGALRELYEIFSPRATGGDVSTNQTETYFADAKGTKNWDKYEFQITLARYDNETHPNELRLKLFLPSSGTIYLRPIKLLGFVSSWWSPQQSGLIGGIGGSVIGCFGALIGLLAGKGKARRFVLTSIKISIALGILLTIAGLVAVVDKQPYAVWYGLLLPGVILTLVFSLNLPSIQRRYDELEIRRMTSVDTMGS